MQEDTLDTTGLSNVPISDSPPPSLIEMPEQGSTGLPLQQWQRELFLIQKKRDMLLAPKEKELRNLKAQMCRLEAERLNECRGSTDPTTTLPDLQEEIIDLDSKIQDLQQTIDDTRRQRTGREVYLIERDAQLQRYTTQAEDLQIEARGIAHLLRETPKNLPSIAYGVANLG